MTEAYRTETAICALSASDLSFNSWANDAITALGLAAIRNPLGNKLAHFIDSPSSILAQEITLMISTRLIKRGFDKMKTLDNAFIAFEYWNGRKCLHCGGRGVMNFQQDTCPRCGGTGERPVPKEYTDSVKEAISILIDAENWLEGQLRAKMAPIHVGVDKAYRMNSSIDYEAYGIVECLPECGSVTPKHKPAP